MFADAGIRICAQVVLCRGINDGKELDRTMRDLEEYLPSLDSVSIVPAGLTKHRDGLYPLSPYTPEECAGIIARVNAAGDRCLEKYGTRVFYPADEFYVKAGLELPGEDFYGDFSQLEDGVGMLTSFSADADRELEYLAGEGTGIPERRISVATGYASFEMISSVAEKTEKLFPAVKINVIRIRNDFFGESVTVSGLLTGGDIAAQAEGLDLGEVLLFPRNALRAEGDLFLDGMTPAGLSEKLGVPVAASECDGGAFVRLMLGIGD
jgi:NifB/MoaA-like Fe-S oxidoreductase